MPQLALIVGVYLVGITFNTFLYGLVLAQFVTYFKTKFEDPLWIRTAVWSLLFTDTIHSVVEIYAIWQTCVENYGNLASFGSVTWPIPFTAVATSVEAIITQLFLAYRVFLLTHSKVLLGTICVSSTLGFIFGLIAGIASGVIQEIAKFGRLVPFVVLWLTFQSLSDFIISASLIAVLARSRTGSRKTHAIINRLIQGAVETGTLASIFALADLFSFVFFRNTNLYAMFGFPIGRIYTNTLLHTLNARAELRNMESIIDCDLEGNSVFRLQSRNRMASGGDVEIPKVN